MFKEKRRDLQFDKAAGNGVAGTRTSSRPIEMAEECICPTF